MENLSKGLVIITDDTGYYSHDVYTTDDLRIESVIHDLSEYYENEYQIVEVSEYSKFQYSVYIASFAGKKYPGIVRAVLAAAEYYRSKTGGIDDVDLSTLIDHVLSPGNGFDTDIHSLAIVKKEVV